MAGAGLSIARLGQGTGTVSGSLTGFPGAPSKCNCDAGFEVEIAIPGQIIVDKVTVDIAGNPLPGNPTPFDFSITSPDSDLPDNFQLADAGAPYTSPFLDTVILSEPALLYNVAETVPDQWALDSANCVSSQGRAGSPARTKAAKVQITRLGATFPLHPLRNLRYFLTELARL